MAPEQIRGDESILDPRVDVYALGVTLYESVTLRLPFDAPNRETLYRFILEKDPVDPRRFMNLPADLVGILQRCLEKQPGNRYATALELSEDLERFRRGESVHAQPISRLRRAARWTRREPLRAALLASAILVLMLGMILVLNRDNIASAREQARIDRQRGLDGKWLSGACDGQFGRGGRALSDGHGGKRRARSRRWSCSQSGRIRGIRRCSRSSR